MGYLTKYKIEIIDGDLEDFERQLIEKKYCTLEQLISREISNSPNANFFNESTKWYDSIKKMEKFSEKHPRATFLLYGDGEDQGDTWKAYFRNGNSVKLVPELVWPEFNESMLP